MHAFPLVCFTYGEVSFFPEWELNFRRCGAAVFSWAKAIAEGKSQLIRTRVNFLIGFPFFLLLICGFMSQNAKEVKNGVYPCFVRLFYCGEGTPETKKAGRMVVSGLLRRFRSGKIFLSCFVDGGDAHAVPIGFGEHVADALSFRNDAVCGDLVLADKHVLDGIRALVGEAGVDFDAAFG